MRCGTHRKRFRDLPISLRILCAFLPIGLALTAVSGMLYYTYARRVLVESVRNQATFMCRRAEHDFIVRYANPIAHDLRLMATSPQFNNYLMSSKEESLIQRAEVERWFLDLSRDSQDCLSSTFLNASGQEEVAVHGNKRARTFRSLEDIAQDGPLGQNMRQLFVSRTPISSPGTRPKSVRCCQIDQPSWPGLARIPTFSPRAEAASHIRAPTIRETSPTAAVPAPSSASACKV